MVTTAGLYLAYEIARGMAVIAGADKHLMEISDQLIRIAEKSTKSRDRREVPLDANFSLNGDAKGDDQLSTEQVVSLVMLLAHSHVQLDLRAMAQTLRQSDSSHRIGNVLILPPEMVAPVALTAIPRLQSFSGLNAARLHWEPAKCQMELAGLIDRSSNAAPHVRPLELNASSSSANVAIRSDSSERLNFELVRDKKSALLPISWRGYAPCLRVTYKSSRVSTQIETLLAEVIVALPMRRQAKAHT